MSLSKVFAPLIIAALPATAHPQTESLVCETELIDGLTRLVKAPTPELDAYFFSVYANYFTGQSREQALTCSTVANAITPDCQQYKRTVDNFISQTCSGEPQPGFCLQMEKEISELTKRCSTEDSPLCNQLNRVAAAGILAFNNLDICLVEHDIPIGVEDSVCRALDIVESKPDSAVNTQIKNILKEGCPPAPEGPAKEFQAGYASGVPTLAFY